eukprot:m.267677 g.267677  ORF g.267677 m.267677 type:complete len:239 (+) comp19287_c2_seq4:73-789(+)
MAGTFDGWVTARLQELGVEDETVAEYLVSLVQMEDSDEESKREDLSEIIAGYIEEGACDVEALVTEILSRWSAESATVKQEEEKAAELRAEQVAAASKQAAADAATFKAPEKTKCLLNAASKDILTAQLSHIIVEDDEGSEGSDDGKEDQWSTSTKPLSQKKERKARKQQDAATAAAFFENTNRSSVQAAAAQARQVSKAQAQAKKAKDKADLSADRDRKEKKKEERRKAAQKGERRR